MQVEANAQQLARYAAMCQAAGLVPIVEPEILIEGGHDIATAAAVSARVISRCVAHLWQQVVSMPARLLAKVLRISGTTGGLSLHQVLFGAFNSWSSV